MTLRGRSILVTGGLGFASSRAPEARGESQHHRGRRHQRKPYGAAFLTVYASPASSGVESS